MLTDSKNLPHVISSTQTGFMSGRTINENTRIIYDLMHITEKKNIAGPLMLVDFEKVFDSISLTFLYNTLQFFDYSKKFIDWIKLFNSDVKAYILQTE